MKQLLNSTATLHKISQQELHGVEAYKISKMLSSIDKQIQLYNQAYNKLLQDCSIKNAEGLINIDQNGETTIQPEKIKLFNEEVTKLLNIKVELNIPYLEINDLENFILSPDEVNKIDWWIKKEEEA